MKYTKRQRHAIYKKALKLFNASNREFFDESGLCAFIAKAEGAEEHWLHFTQDGRLPEIIEQQPRYHHSCWSWWPLDQKGDHKRIKALERCIALTSPVRKKMAGKNFL